jgi:hypothetical protein
MSADNTIAIGWFPTLEGGVEFRVIHAQAIENTEDCPVVPNELTDSYIVSYYHSSEVYTNEDDANKRAVEIYKDVMNDDSGMAYIEYGIQIIEYPRPFPKMTVEEANKYQDEYWASKENKNGTL